MLTLPRTGLLAAPTSVQRKFLFGWSLLQHFCLYPTSIQENLLFGWSQCKILNSRCIPYLHAPRPLIKRQAATNPPGFQKVDIPRFPEPAPPREDTDPATAERLGLDRRQMRDTRRGRHIAQMPPVRAGVRNNSSHSFQVYFNHNRDSYTNTLNTILHI